MATYSHLTDEEFLNHFQSKIDMSPLMTELARRLTTKVEGAPDKDTNHRATCPACDAALTVEYDEGNNLFEVRFDKDSA